MATRARELAGALAVAGGLLAAVGGTAAAHPHVWVATRTQVLFENGAATGLRYTWLFDEMYTTNAVEGLDKNKDGKLDAGELEELTKVNLEGLKEFEYFTQLVVAGEPSQFGDPKDYSMELVAIDDAPGPQMVAGPASDPPAAQPEQRGLWTRLSDWVAGLLGRSPTSPPPPQQAASGAGQASQKQTVLALHMTLPLKQPVPAASLDGTGKGLQFTVSDAQMYIWFEPVPKDGLTLSAGAPAGCRGIYVEPELTPEQKKLAEAFGRAGSAAGVMTPGKSASVSCK